MLYLTKKLIVPFHALFCTVSIKEFLKYNTITVIEGPVNL